MCIDTFQIAGVKFVFNFYELTVNVPTKFQNSHQMHATNTDCIIKCQKIITVLRMRQRNIGAKLESEFCRQQTLWFLSTIR